jgi:exopolyphosphatase/guanosine-5'-triphosphate,3'-diphosphate pyrophosphatase
MDYLGIETLKVHDGGIRDGLLMQMIEEFGLVGAHAGDLASDRLAQARKLADACHYDRHHAIQVARLSLRLFDQLAVQVGRTAATWATPDNRELLHLAALLHDIGCMISYKRHHKHSYRLILEGDLSTLSRRELEIVANVARYHRRGGPRARHENYAKLSDRDQRIVAHLAAILRVADGLDRTHAQEVRGVTLRVQDGVARMAIDAADAPMIGMAAALKKADVFAKVFELEPQFRWAPLEARAGVARPAARR